MNRLNDVLATSVGMILMAAGVAAIVQGVSLKQTGLRLNLGSLPGVLCVLYAIGGGLITFLRGLLKDLQRSEQ